MQLANKFSSGLGLYDNGVLTCGTHIIPIRKTHVYIRQEAQCTDCDHITFSLHILALFMCLRTLHSLVANLVLGHSGSSPPCVLVPAGSNSPENQLYVCAFSESLARMLLSSLISNHVSASSSAMTSGDLDRHTVVTYLTYRYCP